MQKAQSVYSPEKDTLYLSHLYLLGHEDIQTIANYKLFIEKAILNLGEDWRIQASLLTEDLFKTSTISEQENMQNESSHKNFNIFNQFLVIFLKDRLGRQYNSSGEMIESQLQQKFVNKASQIFSKINADVVESLTFQTISLGFWTICQNVWKDAFGDIKKVGKKNYYKQGLRPLAIKYHSKQWKPMRKIQDYFLNEQLNQISLSLAKVNQKNVNKIVTISKLICHQYQISINLKKQQKTESKKVRIILLSQKLYFSGLVIWILFNIKSFFTLSYQQYQRFFFELLDKDENKQTTESRNKRESKLTKNLKHFFEIMITLWSALMKDYTVTLSDDNQVLKIFVKRVKQNLEGMACKQIQQYLLKTLS